MIIENKAPKSVWTERGTSRMRRQKITQRGTCITRVLKIKVYERGRKCDTIQGYKNTLKILVRKNKGT